MNRTEAHHHLNAVSAQAPNTVIDDTYEDYLKGDAKGRKTLRALLALTSLADYENVLAVYEGYTLEELLALEHDYWVCQCDKNYVHSRTEKSRCEQCNYASTFLPSPTAEELNKLKLATK